MKKHKSKKTQTKSQVNKKDLKTNKNQIQSKQAKQSQNLTRKGLPVTLTGSRQQKRKTKGIMTVVFASFSHIYM